MLLAKKSGAALVPVGVSADRRWLVSTWDRYMVPKPFARCLMLYGDPIYLPKTATDEEVVQRLETADLEGAAGDGAAGQNQRDPRIALGRATAALSDKGEAHSELPSFGPTWLTRGDRDSVPTSADSGGFRCSASEYFRPGAASSANFLGIL